MANWCNNYLTFEGEQENVNKVIELFKELREEQSKHGDGVLPKKMNPDEYENRYFFSIYVGDEDVMFESKWVAPNEELKWMAEKYDVEITNWVEEVGCEYYGRVKYFPDGDMQEQLLTVRDFEKFHFDEDLDMYIFEGDEWESESDVLEILWNRRYS